MTKSYHVIFLLISLLFWIGTFLFPDLCIPISIGSLAILMFYIVKVYIRDYAFGVIFVFYFFSFLWAGSSNLYIEMGGYISEQGEFGYPVGSTAAWVFFCLLFSFFSILSFDFFSYRFFIKSRSFFFCSMQEKMIWLSFFILVPFIYLGLMLIYGSPMIEGVERFHFWNKVPHFFARFILFYQFLFIILGILFYHSSKNTHKLFYLFLVFLTIAFLIMASEKFTSLLNVIFYFSIGVLISRYWFEGKKIGFLKTFLYTAPVLLLLLSVVVTNYIVVNDKTVAEAWGRVLNRALGLEGHVWYGVYRDFINGKPFLPEDIVWKIHTEESPTGIVALMWEIAPSNLVEAMRQLKIGFTKGSPAVALSVYGVVGAGIVSVIGGLFVGTCISLVYYSVRSNRLYLLVFIMILYRTLIDIFVTGDYYFFYSNALIFSIVFILISFLFVFILRGGGFVFSSDRRRILWGSHS